MNAVDFFMNNMGRYELLDHKVICALAETVQAWQTHEDGPDNAPFLVRCRGKAARDKIVNHNLRLIVHIWQRNYSRLLPVLSPSESPRRVGRGPFGFIDGRTAGRLRESLLARGDGRRLPRGMQPDECPRIRVSSRSERD